MDNSIQVAGQFAQYEQNYPVEFTGRAGEYFRIWIVNLALTIVTLGIYSAWAKVRKKRYFYGNTLIAGEPFEYRGNPVNILKGRIIAAALLALNYALSRFYPALYIPFLILLAVAVPWLVCRSLAFNAHNSAYRNVTFGFTGRYGEALKVIIGIALLIPFTLGLIYPYYKMRQMRFIAGHHRYGGTQFNPFLSAGKFYRIYLISFGLLLLLAFVFGIVMALVGVSGVLPRGASGNGSKALTVTTTILFSLPVYALYLFAFCYVHARITNVVWNNLKLGAVSFVSTLRARELFLLYLGNILVILFTLGLATPWASIRNARYRISKTSVSTTASLDTFTAEAGRDVSATGEAVSEMFDIDIGL